MIDPESSSEIMYHNFFKKLDLSPSQIKNDNMLVFSFSSKAIWHIAIAEVPVGMGEVQKMVEFIVMDINSPYKVVLGRTWLGMMKEVASPYHQKLKFTSEEGIVVIWKIIRSRHCFGMAV